MGAYEFSPPPPGPGSALTLSARPRRVAAGGRSLLRGKLTDGAGVGLAGRTVVIMSARRTVKVLRTNAAGGFSRKVTLVRTKRFRARFYGDGGTHPAAVSKEVTVTVRR